MPCLRLNIILRKENSIYEIYISLKMAENCPMYSFTERAMILMVHFRHFYKGVPFPFRVNLFLERSFNNFERVASIESVSIFLN